MQETLVHVENLTCQIDEQNADEICSDESSQSCVEPIDHDLPIVRRDEGQTKTNTDQHTNDIYFLATARRWLSRSQGPAAFSRTGNASSLRTGGAGCPALPKSSVNDSDTTSSKTACSPLSSR